MTDKLSLALNAADTAALRRVRYRSAAEHVVAEADALAAQAEAKRAESMGLLAEAERQDAAYEAAIGQAVELGVDRGDAESMVALRVKMLVKAGVDIPLPIPDPAKAKTKGSPLKKAKASGKPMPVQGASADAGVDAEGDAGAETGDGGTDAPPSEPELRQEGRKPFRLPEETGVGGERNKGD